MSTRQEMSEIEKTWSKEGVSNFLGEILFRLYGLIDRRVVRWLIRWLTLRLEKGIYYSRTIRRIFSVYHGIDVGMYSGCGNFSTRIFLRGTKIGRYTTVNDTVRSFTANHPINMKSSHALFYNHKLGIIKGPDIIRRGTLTIGNDVFIGHNAILLPSVKTIGDGAFIGAGAVVTRSVPPYAILAGNPAKIMRYRYPENVVKEMLESRWWNKSIDELKSEIESFHKPLDESDTTRQMPT